MKNKLFIGVLLLLLSCSATTYAQNFCVSCLSVRIGHATLGRDATPGRPDSPFHLYSTALGTVGYSNDITSYSIANPSSTGSGGTEQVALSPITGSYNSGGVWIESLITQGSTYYAVFHAETPASCTVPQNTVHRSMGIASSSTPFSFTQLSQIIDYPDDPSNCGEADGSVIHWSDGNYYMYLSRPSDCAEIRAMMTPGNPTQWYKYACPPGTQLGGTRCGFNILGTGDDTNANFTVAPLSVTPAMCLNAGSVASWNSNVILTGMNNGDPQVGGAAVVFSSDGMHFTALQDPLIPIESSHSDQTLYFSLADPTQSESNQIVNNSNFEFFYTYVKPFVPLDGSHPRYLVSRSISWNVGSQSLWPQVGIELSRYYNPTTYAHWGTTALATPVSNWSYEGSLGYLMTRGNPPNPPAPLTALYDCQVGTNDYMNSIDPQCEGTTKLRLLGYVFQTPPSNLSTQPIYRCLLNSPAGYHMTSKFSNCENAGTNEGLLGYTMTQ